MDLENTYLYILDNNGEPTITQNYKEWLDWMENNKIVDSDKIQLADGNIYRFSTVFLGFNYNFSNKKCPILFATMIFPEHSYDDLFTMVYFTIEEARIGHRHTVMEYQRMSVEELNECIRK